MIWQLDPTTMLFATSLVVVIVVLAYLIDAVTRRTRSAGRAWGFAFLALGVSAFGRLAAHSVDLEGWAALALSDVCFVIFLGALWYGMRRYNGRRGFTATAVWVTLALLVIVSTCVSGATGEPLVRMIPLAAVSSALAIAAAVECRRGRMGRNDTVLLTIVLGATGLTNAIWCIALLLPVTIGVDGPLVTSAALMVVLAIVGAITITARRAADDASAALPVTSGSDALMSEDVLPADTFESLVGVLAARAEARGEQIAVLAMIAVDVPSIGAALGSVVQRRIESTWRESWLHRIPVSAVPGEPDRACLAVILAPSTVGEARRIGNRVYGQVVEDLARLDGVVLPVTGFGVALSGSVPAAALVASARAAALASTSTPAQGLTMSDDEIVERTLPPRP